ncbi:MAG: hypothetical protein ABSA93_40215 [Streptosporangiaceae bacterium]
MRFGTLIARKSSAAAPAAASTPAASAPAVRALRVRYRHWWWLPGWTFAAVTLFPALLAIAWLVPGVALLLAGRFASVPMLIMFPALTLALGYFVLRQLPVSWPRFRENPKRKEPAARRPDVPLDVLILVIAVAAGYFVWQLAMSSQDVIVTSDAGAFLQYAYWIAGHGTAHISQSAFAFGGTVPGANFASYGFYQTGATITPAFMAGLPIVLAAGVWAGGASGAIVFGPVIGACAVLAFAGLAGRLAGPRWAPAAALLLAVELPEQYTSRATFSEGLVQVLLFGGLCMIIDSMVMTARRHGISRIGGSAAVWQVRVLAFVGGLSVGLSVLVSVSSLDYLVPVLLFLAILGAGRRVQALPLLVGAVAGVALSLAAGYELDRPYLRSLPLRSLALAGLGALAVSAVVAALLIAPPVRGWLRRALAFRRWRIPSLGTALPWIAAALPVVALGLFLARPYLQTIHIKTPNSIIANIQQLEGYRPDGTRTYAEDSLYWVIWYLGLPALLLGVAGFAMLSWRCLRALLHWRDVSTAARIWALPLMIFGWGAVTVLWAPDVVPSQPDAARRLVPIVIPGLIAAGVWVASRLKMHARALGAGLITAGAAATCCVLAMGIPSVVTTLGLSSSGHDVSVGGVAAKRLDQGELAAVRGVCSAIGSDSSVIIVSPSVGSSWAQVIRGMCATPVVRAAGSAVSLLVAGAERVGRHPILLGSSADALSSYGGVAREVLSLVTWSETPSLIRPPQGETAEHYVLWLSAPDGQTAVSATA